MAETPVAEQAQGPPRPHLQQMYLQGGDDAYESAGGKSLPLRPT